ncbi:hypothetical protein Cpha266_1355 [Chlorobium phaeobacteroides DSM 266]|uniref:Uncharacterized protein n=1 Tax=Chlorobium phaeobacteroides (strain DSM 266 / SMG 266 / 2430) TaxID=290317 RepID=A1BG59_CHLPD|nr:hypothetical protein Cpha266_1355 [Chlorobium phaeobacteroides DSM 266]
MHLFSPNRIRNVGLNTINPSFGQFEPSAHSELRFRLIGNLSLLMMNSLETERSSAGPKLFPEFSNRLVTKTARRQRIENYSSLGEDISTSLSSYPATESPGSVAMRI